MSYAECLKKYYNAVDGAFYDAIKTKDQGQPTQAGWQNEQDGPES